MRRAGRLFRCCRAPADRTSRSATCWPLGKAARTGPACKCSAPQHRRSRPTESPWPGRTHSRGSLARSCKRGPRSASPNEVFQFWQDRRESWSVLEIGGPNPVDLDGLGVNWPIRVEPGAPRLTLAPALAFAQHFHETDFDDDARGVGAQPEIGGQRWRSGRFQASLRETGMPRAVMRLSTLQPTLASTFYAGRVRARSV